MDVSIVVRDHGPSEALLTGRIPQLQTDLFVVHDDGLFAEVDSDRGLTRPESELLALTLTVA